MEYRVVALVGYCGLCRWCPHVHLVRICVCLLDCLYVRMQVCLNGDVRMYACMHVCIYVSMYVCMYVLM